MRALGWGLTLGLVLSVLVGSSLQESSTRKSHKHARHESTKLEQELLAGERLV